MNNIGVLYMLSYKLVYQFKFFIPGYISGHYVYSSQCGNVRYRPSPFGKINSAFGIHEIYHFRTIHLRRIVQIVVMVEERSPFCYLHGMFCGTMH